MYNFLMLFNLLGAGTGASYFLRLRLPSLFWAVRKYNKFTYLGGNILDVVVREYNKCTYLGGDLLERVVREYVHCTYLGCNLLDNVVREYNK